MREEIALQRLLGKNCELSLGLLTRELEGRRRPRIILQDS